MDLNISDLLSGAKRIVIKIGSALVTNEGKGIDALAVGAWCYQIAQVVRADCEVIVISSGAVAEGMKRLGISKRPSAINELQACAAVGQMGLAQIYESQFHKHGHASAQVLLTHADLSDRERYLNARSTLLTLLQFKVVPVINENDSVVNDEIKFGDNDTLGALVTNLVDADLLIILTDQKGLFTDDPRKNPKAEFIALAKAGDPMLELMAGGEGSSFSRGGMITKILAAKRAAGSGACTVIAWGREPNIILRLSQGEHIGTFLHAKTAKNQARKQWMVDHLQLKGAVSIDDGATHKVCNEGKSLLPIGVVGVTGEFSRGDVIAICSQDGLEIARGLANYASSEVRLLLCKASGEIEHILGYSAEPEIVHRDNLVLSVQ
jgi:glutamate 5-kinase